MKTTITMGNDEFILYIRKNFNCTLTNDRIGRMIWKWILENSKGIRKERDIIRNVPCLWQVSKVRKTYGLRLPRIASQITFERKLLPKLYTFLDEIGEKFSNGDSFDMIRKRELEETDTSMPELEF